MKKFLFALFPLIFFYSNAVADATATSNGLKVDFSITNPQSADSGKIEMLVKFTNISNLAIEFDGTYLPSSQLFLKLRDSGNNLITSLGPPPLPKAENEKPKLIHLKPGQSKSLKYSGIPGSSLTPGKYQVKFTYSNTAATGWSGNIETNWVDFTISPR